MPPVSPDEIRQRMTAVKTRIEDIIEAIPNGLLNTRPDPKRWSIAEVIRHLAVVNHSYEPIFHRLINMQTNAGWQRHFRGLAHSMGGWMVRYLDPKSTKPTQTLPRFKPKRVEFNRSDVEADIQTIEMTMNHMLLLPDGTRRWVVSSPASPLFMFIVDDMIEFTIRHHERHLNQIERILEATSNA